MSASEYWSRMEHYRDQLRAYEDEGERQARELSEFWGELDPAEKMAALNAIESRTTGETLMQLVSQSSSTLRLAAPFIDLPGISFLADALAAATARGASVQILLPTRSTHAVAALGQLEATIRGDGNIDHYSVGSLRFDAPWAHLKVLSCDSMVAYIGSANVTGAGMAGPNLELGVLVRGPAVATVDRVLDLYMDGGRA